MHQQTWELTNTIGVGASGLRVFFVPNRATVQGCTVHDLPLGATVTSSIHSDLGADIRWSGDLPPDARITLSATLEGEPLVIAAVVWCDPNGDLVPVVGSLGKHAGLLLAAAGSIADFATYSAAMFLVRCQLVHANSNIHFRRYGSFFCDLDLYTNGKLLPYSGLPREEIIRRNGIITVMEKCLIARLRARWAGQVLPSSTGTEVKYISSVLLEIYRQHLSTTGCKIDPEEVWAAFELFANGELRVQLDNGLAWNSEPDSGAFFCFAEFGLMAIERGVDVAEWTAILPSHVAVQQIFLAAYRPNRTAPGPFAFEEYKSTNWAREKMVGPATKARLRAAFWDMPVEKLKDAAREHLLAAFSQVPNSPCPVQ